MRGMGENVELIYPWIRRDNGENETKIVCVCITCVFCAPVTIASLLQSSGGFGYTC